MLADHAGSRLGHAAGRAQRIVRGHLCRRQPEQRVGATHRLLNHRGIAVLTGDDLCTAAG